MLDETFVLSSKESFLSMLKIVNYIWGSLICVKGTEEGKGLKAETVKRLSRQFWYELKSPWIRVVANEMENKELKWRIKRRRLSRYIDWERENNLK